MQKPNIFLIQILIMILGLFASTRAQDTILISVFGNGVSISQNDNHRLSATFGQPLIGAGKNETTTISGGFWTSITEITTSTEQIEESSLPQEFSLDQNYPNPFNPITTISWQSPVGSWQTLEVYDMLGRKIATLVDEFKPAGSYEVEFNAAELSSGTYFYRLQATLPGGRQVGGQAGEFVETKKLILMK
jgi:hypothetical protein